MDGMMRLDVGFSMYSAMVRGRSIIVSVPMFGRDLTMVTVLGPPSERVKSNSSKDTSNAVGGGGRGEGEEEEEEEEESMIYSP